MQLSLWNVLLIVALVAAAIVILVVFRRRRYVASLRSQGWTFDPAPTLAAAYGLNCPPFGLGYGRRIDDLIAGRTVQGVPFRVFEYGRSGSLAVLALPCPLPEFYLGTARRPGANGLQRTFGAWTVTAKDPAWAEAAIATIRGSVDALAAAHPVDLSVDGAWLVAAGAPRKAAALKDFLDAVGQVALRFADGGLAGFQAGPPPAELSLYEHPTWTYRPSDDDLLEQVVVTTGGSGHRAQDAVLAVVHGMRMIGLTHTWQTTRTVATTDGQGRTTTRTQTDHHSEAVLEFHLPWRFVDVSVNWPAWGEKVRFESSDFERLFTVRCPVPKFASDVFHPRQLEYLIRARPLPFAIESGRVRFDVPANDPAVMASCSDFLVAFFAGVPGFVWTDLGHPEPPISRELVGF